jgi:hypothetical protein
LGRSQGIPCNNVSHFRPKFKYATKSTTEEKSENPIEPMATLTAVMKAKQYLEKVRALKKFE